VSTSLEPAPVDAVFAALSSPVRRSLLEALRAGPQPVGRLAGDLPVSRPAVSQHLAVLRAARLVSEERAGRERRYRLEPGPLREAAAWLAHYEDFWRDRLGALRALVDADPSPATPRSRP
jgi:DNA-binding transcriptional ArsR family regulator